MHRCRPVKRLRAGWDEEVLLKILTGFLREQDAIALVTTQPFLYYWLSTDAIMETMRRRGIGVAIPELNSTAVR